MTLIDTRPLVESIRAEVTAEVSALTAAGVTPTLAAVVATGDPGTAWYLRSIIKAATDVGIGVQRSRPATAYSSWHAWTSSRWIPTCTGSSA